MRDDCINKLDYADTQLEEITDSPYSNPFASHKETIDSIASIDMLNERRQNSEL